MHAMESVPNVGVSSRSSSSSVMGNGSLIKRPSPAMYTAPEAGSPSLLEKGHAHAHTMYFAQAPASTASPSTSRTHKQRRSDVSHRSARPSYGSSSVGEESMLSGYHTAGETSSANVSLDVSAGRSSRPRKKPRRSAYDTFDEVSFCNDLAARIRSELANKSAVQQASLLHYYREASGDTGWRGSGQYANRSLNASAVDVQESDMVDSAVQTDLGLSLAGDESTQYLDARDEDTADRQDADDGLDLTDDIDDANEMRPERTERTKAAAQAFLEQLAKRRDTGAEERDANIEDSVFQIFGRPEEKPSHAGSEDRSDRDIELESKVQQMLHDQKSDTKKTGSLIQMIDEIYDDGEVQSSRSSSAGQDEKEVDITHASEVESNDDVVYSQSGEEAEDEEERDDEGEDDELVDDEESVGSDEEASSASGADDAPYAAFKSTFSSGLPAQYHEDGDEEAEDDESEDEEEDEGAYDDEIDLLRQDANSNFCAELDPLLYSDAAKLEQIPWASSSDQQKPGHQIANGRPDHDFYEEHHAPFALAGVEDEAIVLSDSDDDDEGMQAEEDEGSGDGELSAFIDKNDAESREGWQEQGGKKENIDLSSGGQDRGLLENSDAIERFLHDALSKEQNKDMADGKTDFAQPEVTDNALHFSTSTGREEKAPTETVAQARSVVPSFIEHSQNRQNGCGAGPKVDESQDSSMPTVESVESIDGNILRRQSLGKDTQEETGYATFSTSDLINTNNRKAPESRTSTPPSDEVDETSRHAEAMQQDNAEVINGNPTTGDDFAVTTSSHDEHAQATRPADDVKLSPDARNMAMPEPEEKEHRGAHSSPRRSGGHRGRRSDPDGDLADYIPAEPIPPVTPRQMRLRSASIASAPEDENDVKAEGNEDRKGESLFESVAEELPETIAEESADAEKDQEQAVSSPQESPEILREKPEAGGTTSEPQNLVEENQEGLGEEQAAQMSEENAEKPSPHGTRSQKAADASALNGNDIGPTSQGEEKVESFPAGSQAVRRSRRKAS